MGTVAGLGVVVPTVAPLGIESYRPTPGAPPRDLLGRGGRTRSDSHQPTNPVGVHDAPLQHLHSPHRPSDDRVPLTDAQSVGQPRLGSDDVTHGDHREVRPVAVRLVGTRRCRARGPLASPEHVGTDHEPPLRVDGLARSDQVVPPTRCGMPVARWPRRMGVTGQRMAHQDGVGAIGV